MRPLEVFRFVPLLGAMIITGFSAFADSGQWRWAVGAQLDPASHGIVDLGYRTKSLSIQWLTDTLDLRYKKRVERGQWEVGLRGALFGAELLFSPWEAGRPAPEKALRASYLGVDLSRAWWFRDGFYAGTSMEFRYYDFGQWQDATRIIPEARGRIRAAFKLGVWRSELRAHVLGGLNLDGDHRGWWTEGRLSFPQGEGFGVINQTHLGWSEGLSRLSRFRLGGLNPYVLPFSGLGWAQFWVERYALQRLGLGFKSQDEVFELGLGTDLGIWDREQLRASPFLSASYMKGHRRFSISGGVVAWEKERPGVHGWSLFLWYERSWR